MSRLFSSSTSTCGYMVTPSVITFCYVGCRRCRIPIYLSNFDWPLAVFRPSETKTRIYVHMYGRGKTPERKTIETILAFVQISYGKRLQKLIISPFSSIPHLLDMPLLHELTMHPLHRTVPLHRSSLYLPYRCYFP